VVISTSTSISDSTVKALMIVLSVITNSIPITRAQGVRLAATRVGPSDVLDGYAD
jgi:hypothetical protein